MSMDYRYRYLAENSYYDSRQTTLVKECNKWVDVLNEALDELKALNEKYGVENVEEAVELLPLSKFDNYRLAYIHITEKGEEAYEHYKQLKEELEGGKNGREITLNLSDTEQEVLCVEHISGMYQEVLQERVENILHGLLEDYAKMAEPVTVYFYNQITDFGSRKNAMNFYMQSIREEKSPDAINDYAVILAKLDAGEKEIYLHCEKFVQDDLETKETGDEEYDERE